MGVLADCGVGDKAGSRGKEEFLSFLCDGKEEKNEIQWNFIFGRAFGKYLRSFLQQ
jgi:hypothetical protein